MKRYMKIFAQHVATKALNFFKEYILNPLSYSISGMDFMRHERSFRVELFCGVVAWPIYFMVLGLSWKLVVITSCYFILLLTECLNTAIESVVDLYTEEHHVLAKRAKDTASAAVYIALSNIVVVTLFLFFV